MESYIPVEVDYCTLCTFPKEFCEFSPTPEKCEKFNKEDAEKKEVEEESTNNEKKDDSEEIKILIDVVQVKNRVITKIKGLEKLGLDLRNMSKKMSKKIGCGCSKGKEGLELQGPNSDKAIEMLIKEMNGKLTLNNFKVTENIKKKKRKKKK